MEFLFFVVACWALGLVVGWIAGVKPEPNPWTQNLARFVFGFIMLIVASLSGTLVWLVMDILRTLVKVIF